MSLIMSHVWLGLILVDLNPVALNYYTFIVSLDKCNESCNVVEDLSTKIYFANEKEEVNVTVFNMLTRINESKALGKNWM